MTFVLKSHKSLHAGSFWGFNKIVLEAHVENQTKIETLQTQYLLDDSGI